MLRLAIVTLISLVSLAAGAAQLTMKERQDLNGVFKKAGVIGTFALLDVSANHMTLVNAARAKQRFIPASTFKFANSLISLELGVVSDDQEVIPYGGQPQPFRVWERDMTIGQAFAVSNVPVFQTLARRVGVSRYQSWLADIQYGNATVGTQVERFWLDGPLKISAVEQAQFMARIATNSLPFSKATFATVHEISEIERRKASVLHGKTGWTIAPEPDLGWFVGWVMRRGDVFAFALNLDIQSRSDAKLRRSLTIQLLERLGVY